MQAFAPLLIVLVVGVPVVTAAVWLMDRSAQAVSALPPSEGSSQDDSALTVATVALTIISANACDPNDAASACSVDPGS